MQCLLTIAYALVTPFGGFVLLTGCGCAWQCTGDRIAISDRIFLLITISFIYTNRVKSRFAEHFTRRVDKPAVFAYYNRNKGVVCPFAMVNLYARGQGADKFRGVYDNTEIFHKLAELTDVQ